jgi:hypothetical protein
MGENVNCVLFLKISLDGKIATPKKPSTITVFKPLGVISYCDGFQPKMLENL